MNPLPIDSLVAQRIVSTSDSEMVQPGLNFVLNSDLKLHSSEGAREGPNFNYKNRIALEGTMAVTATTNQKKIKLEENGEREQDAPVLGESKEEEPLNRKRPARKGTYYDEDGVGGGFLSICFIRGCPHMTSTKN